MRQVRADLLIVDIMMPGLNGLEVYDRLRADSDIPSMPVLFISALAEAHEAELRRRGVTDIAKPFDVSALIDHVRRLCPLEGAGTTNAAAH